MWLAFSVKSLPHTTHQNQDVLIARNTLLVCMHSGKCVYVCLYTPWLFSDFSVAVTCIMTDGMECPFMYLLTTCIFSPVKCLLKSFASILIGLSFILPCESPQPLWDGRPLPNKWIAVLPSPSVVHLFYVLDSILGGTHFKIFDKLIDFCCCCCLYFVSFKEISAWFKVKNTYSTISFIFLPLTFGSLYMPWGRIANSSFCMFLFGHPTAVC